MTLREGDEAAAKHLPIESGGIVYVRILEIGYKYTENGARVPFVRLKDKSGRSITDADPVRCKIVENPTAQEAEQLGLKQKKRRQRVNEAKIIYADAVCGLKELPDESIDCCVTSPPYYGLRDYGHDGQIGLEASVEEYIERLLEVFREVHRVMKPDGTLWVNINDSYAGSGKGAAKYPDNAKKYKQGTSKGILGAAKAAEVKPRDAGIKPKDLMGIPFILALALRAEGWYWRQVILWEKPNAMPESANDRCTESHEYVLLFAKSRRYYFDYEAIMEPAVGFDRTPPAGGRGTLRPNSRRRKGNAKSFRGGGAYTAHQTVDNSTDAERKTHGNTPNDTGLRRKRTVWSIATKGYTSANGEHYATFPPQLAKNCILAGCKVGGTVLDPFIGSGTVAEVALKHGRNCVGIELNPAYQTLIEERIQNGKRESK